MCSFGGTEKDDSMIPQRVLINLLLLCCVIGGMTFFLITNDAEVEVQGPLPLTDVPIDSISSIRVERGNLDDLILQKQGAEWYMQSPFQLLANPARVGLMLDMLYTPSYHQFSAADHDLVPFMLAAPVVTIVLNDLRIAFGSTSPVEEMLRYVLVKDSVHVINDGLLYYLKSSPTIFLALRLLPENALLHSIALPNLYIEDRLGQALSEEHQRVVDVWTELEALSISKYVSTEPLYEVRLELVGGEVIELLVLATSPYVILARPNKGVQYHIDDPAVTQLLVAVSGSLDLAE